MCHELNEDKVLDLMEDKQKPGGLIVEHHVPDLFPGKHPLTKTILLDAKC